LTLPSHILLIYRKFCLGHKNQEVSNSHYKNRFFESPPSAGFQKTDFGVSSTFGAGNTKIGFIMRIAVLDWVTEI
jgi:hypothetical protein